MAILEDDQKTINLEVLSLRTNGGEDMKDEITDLERRLRFVGKKVEVMKRLQEANGGSEDFRSILGEYRQLQKDERRANHQVEEARQAEALRRQREAHEKEIKLLEQNMLIAQQKAIKATLKKKEEATKKEFEEHEILSNRKIDAIQREIDEAKKSQAKTEGDLQKSAEEMESIVVALKKEEKEALENMQNFQGDVKQAEAGMKRVQGELEEITAQPAEGLTEEQADERAKLVKSLEDKAEESKLQAENMKFDNDLRLETESKRKEENEERLKFLENQRFGYSQRISDTELMIEAREQEKNQIKAHLKEFKEKLDKKLAEEQIREEKRMAAALKKEAVALELLMCKKGKEDSEGFELVWQKYRKENPLGFKDMCTASWKLKRELKNKLTKNRIRNSKKKIAC